MSRDEVFKDVCGFKGSDILGERFMIALFLV